MRESVCIISSQRPDKYPNGGDEAYWTARIAHMLRADLGARGIKCREEGDEAGWGLLLYICSHAAPREVEARIKGAQVSYYEYSPAGRRAAEIFTKYIREVYPQPDLVEAVPAVARAELSESKVPALLIHLGYHDNPQDEAWLVNSAEQISAELAAAAADFLEAEP